MVSSACCIAAQAVLCRLEHQSQPAKVHDWNIICAAHVRYWLGAGRGGFGLSASECLAPTFYCQVYTTPEGDIESERSMTVKTSEVPIKPSFFATVKSNNYLPNVLTVMDAQADGFDQVCPVKILCMLDGAANV